MAIGRALSILNLYDLLANLIPGMAWAIVLVVLFPVDWFGLSPTGAPGTFVAAVIIFGYTGGHMLQWAGSDLDKRLRKRDHDGKDLFSRTMEAVEGGDEDSPIGKVTDVEESFFDLAKEQFDLPDDFPKSSKVLLLVLSYLETRPATRASRFQAIHTFHRSLWAGAIFSFGSAVLAVILMALGWVDNGWITPGLILLGSALSIHIFSKRKNKFERTYLRYVFLDFYQDQKVKKHEQNT